MVRHPLAVSRLAHVRPTEDKPFLGHHLFDRGNPFGFPFERTTVAFGVVDLAPIRRDTGVKIFVPTDWHGALVRQAPRQCKF
jgi:hypothetical protein